MLLLLWRVVIKEGPGIPVSKSQLLSQPETQRMFLLSSVFVLLILSWIICCLHIDKPESQLPSPKDKIEHPKPKIQIRIIFFFRTI